METHLIATPPPQREMWGAATVMLSGAFQLGCWTCRLDMPGATPWSLSNMLIFAGSVGMVTFGLLTLRNLIRYRVRGTVAGTAAS